MQADRDFPAFLSNLWITLGGLTLCLLSFFYYVQAEKEIDLANNARLRSFLLASELRQSSDDLTRMARTYVATGKSIYKQHYQEILDIRDGRSHYPMDPANIYWDFVGENNFRPRPSSGNAMPLLERLKLAGFTEQEFSKLAKAKKESDDLTAVEFAAMKLIESEPGNQAIRSRATRMLYDDKYHAAKAAIMAPISEVYRMMDERTLRAVNHAIRIAMALRYVFIAFVLLFAFLLWRTYRALTRTLGATPDELYRCIARLGRGEFTSLEPATGKSSVLDWLLESESKLARAEAERKEAEQLVRKWSEAFSHAAMGIALGDVATNTIVEVNQAFASMMGCSIDELKGKPILSLYPDSERAHVLQEITQVLDEDHSRYESRLERKDGSTFPVQVDLATIRDEIGKPVFRVATAQDITWRREAESELRLQGEITQKAAAGIVVVKAEDGCIHYANQRFEEMFGYGSGELLGRPISLINAPTDKSPEETAAEIMMALHREGRWAGEVLNRRKDASEIWTVANISSFQHPELGTLLISHQTDITERKQLENALNNFAREIEDLYDNAPCGYHSIDADGKIVKINQTELDWLGYSREEMIGKPVIDFITPASRQAVREIFDSFMKEGRVHDAEREFVRKDGTILPVQLKSTAIYDMNGKFLMSRTVLTDITERKKMEEVLRIASTAFESQEGMMITDANANIISVNRAFTEITGYSADEVIGKNPRMLQSGRIDANFYGSMWHAIKNEGYWSGEIWNRKKSGEIYPEHLTITAVKNDNGHVTNYVGSMLDITDRKISEEQIQQLAYYDYLTGLPNRRLFRDRLEQDAKRVMRNNTSLALLFIDLDRFKEVNDTLGHDKGDILLVEAARRVRQHVRETDTLARLGGDEFTVILPEYGEGVSIERVVQSVVRDLAMPFDLGDGDVGHISCSVGIALYPQDAGNIEDLLKHADQAMYAAKLAGRNGFSYFTQTMQEEAKEKLSLINDLHLALERGQMEVYFQPIVDARNGEIAKAEALLRWHHPVRGMVSPDVFIPFAEESGLILEIGEWVFEETLKCIAEWREHTGKLVQVSVNKSPMQFMRAEAHPWLENYLKSGLPPKTITVEITEGLLLSESEKVKQDFINFRENGIELSIDDFGTGFSALSYLNRFDVDYLKIDKAFVQKMTADSSSRSLTEAIVLMAHKLGIRVIAEGVETEEQRDLLASFGCDYLQGFLFSKPVPAGEFEKMLGIRKA